MLILRQLPVEPVAADPEFDDGRLAASWRQGFRMISNFKFLRELTEYQRERLNGETIELLEVYMDMEDFDASFAKRTCGKVSRSAHLRWRIDD